MHQDLVVLEGDLGTGKTTAFGGIAGSSTVARTTAKIENAALLKVPPLSLPLISFTAITAAVEDKYNGSIHTRSVAGTQFVGLKIAWLNDLYGGKFPITTSLGFIAGVIALSVIASLLFPRGRTSVEATVTRGPS